MKKSMKMSAGASVTKGLKNMSPSSSDKSTNLKMSPTVSGMERSIGTAPTPKTLGPRTA